MTEINTAALPGGITGVAYETKLAATGGTTPYVWAKTSGSLPDGLILSAAGVISGTPTTAGAFKFSVSATDATGSDDETSFTITITAADVPGKPTKLKAEPGNGSVALAWDAPSSDGGNPISKYEAKVGDDESWATVTGKSHTFSGLTNGTLYTFSVRAVNVKGAGEAATVTARPAATNAGGEEGNAAGTSSSAVTETPDFTPLANDVEIGTGTKEITPNMLDELPSALNDAVAVTGGKVVADVKAASAGLSEEDAALIELDDGAHPMIPLPVIGTHVSEEGKTAVFTFENRLAGFEGYKLGELAILKLMKTADGSSTVPLKQSNSLPEIADGQYVWTDKAGTAYGDSTVIDKGEYYCLNVAVKDDGPYDWETGEGRKVLDPLTIALKKAAGSEDEGKDENTALSGGGGGCDAGALSILALAAAVSALAARRRKTA
jgi:hypothetical protein